MHVLEAHPLLSWRFHALHTPHHLVATFPSCKMSSYRAWFSNDALRLWTWLLEHTFSVRRRDLSPCRNRYFPAPCTLGTEHSSRNRSGRSSPCRATLASCTATASPSVWYKSTASCSLCTPGKHTGYHSCSMLKIRGVSQEGQWFFYGLSKHK